MAGRRRTEDYVLVRYIGTQTAKFTLRGRSGGTYRFQAGQKARHILRADAPDIIARPDMELGDGEALLEAPPTLPAPEPRPGPTPVPGESQRPVHTEYAPPSAVPAGESIGDDTVDDLPDEPPNFVDLDPRIADILIDRGINAEAVAELSDEDLLAVPGIGPAKLAAIRAAVA